MEKLEIYRDLIDSIDNQIIELYVKRMEIVKEITKLKIDNNLPVLDQNREKIMLEKNLEKIKDEEFKKYYKSVLEGFLKASKEMQKDIIAKQKSNSICDLTCLT